MSIHLALVYSLHTVQRSQEVYISNYFAVTFQQPELKIDEESSSKKQLELLLKIFRSVTSLIAATI